MVLNVHRNHKAYYGRGDFIMEVGEEGDYIHCHHQNDFCIKIGSDKSHFNVSLIVRDKVTRQCPRTATTFEEKGEPKRIRTEVLLLTSLLLGHVDSSVLFMKQHSCQGRAPRAVTLIGYIRVIGR